MQPVLRFNQALFQPQFKTAQTFVQRFIQQFLLRLRRFTQHIAGHFIFVTRMADAKPQTVKIQVVAKFAGNIFQTIVTGVATTATADATPAAEVQESTALQRQVLSAMMTPAAPDLCAFLTLFTKVHPPRSTMRM